jgi:hypothetical protein
MVFWKEMRMRADERCSEGLKAAEDPAPDDGRGADTGAGVGFSLTRTLMMNDDNIAAVLDLINAPFFQRNINHSNSY